MRATRCSSRHQAHAARPAANTRNRAEPSAVASAPCEAEQQGLNSHGGFGESHNSLRIKQRAGLLYLGRGKATCMLDVNATPLSHGLCTQPALTHKWFSKTQPRL